MMVTLDIAMNYCGDVPLKSLFLKMFCIVIDQEALLPDYVLLFMSLYVKWESLIFLDFED